MKEKTHHLKGQFLITDLFILMYINENKIISNDFVIYILSYTDFSCETIECDKLFRASFER